MHIMSKFLVRIVSKHAALSLSLQMLSTVRYLWRERQQDELLHGSVAAQSAALLEEAHALSNEVCTCVQFACVCLRVNVCMCISASLERGLYMHPVCMCLLLAMAYPF